MSSPLLPFRTTPTGGMSAGTVLNKLAETADWRKTLADLEAAAATFRRTVNLIG